MHFPLFETLAIIDGQPQNLAYHQHRYQNSLSKFYPNQLLKFFELAHIITAELAIVIQSADFGIMPNLLRCRIDYNATTYQVGFFAYTKKSYASFKPVICDSINYPLKFTDRQIFADLLAHKGSADEILIIKNGLVTDCTIGNVILKKQGEWFTPNTPLLLGTQRANLLDAQIISEREIPLQTIDTYEEIRLINVLNGLGF